MLFHYSGKEGQLQELCEFPGSANILSSTSVHIKENFRNQRPQCVIKKTRKIRGMTILTMVMLRQVR
jgi:hypothetical protein